MTKKKVTRAEFDALEAEVKELKSMLAASKPALKKLDQSAFEHEYVTDALQYAAINKDGQSIFFSKKPVINTKIGCWSADSGRIMPMMYGYDASDWQNSLIERKPKLKTLDQSVFDGLGEKWQWAKVSSVGIPFVYSYKPAGRIARFSDSITQEMISAGKIMCINDCNYDASDWQNSLIQRESKELKGSDLARAMLARGDKCVMAKVCDDERESYRAIGSVVDFNGSLFRCSDNCRWGVAIPINPRTGEPLTAKEAGF